VSTLSPHAVLDSGYPFDARFASGVFVYRTADRLPEDKLRRLTSVSPSTLAHVLDENPPAAILVGYERRLDAGFRNYAIARGYRVETSPFGKGQLYIR
jgi:hypothetical protein